MGSDSEDVCRSATGIAQCDPVATYTEQVQELTSVCMRPEDRAAAMVQLANGALAAQSIPANSLDASGADGNAGQFDYRSWGMQIDPTAFSDENMLDPALAADAANTVYHESRHTEQWYRMARMRAGMGDSTAELQKSMKIPAAIAAQAMASPMNQCDAEELEAEDWWNSVYGAGRVDRGQVLSAEPMDPAKYCALPEESDAWATGAEVTQSYPGGVDARNLQTCN